MKTKGKTVIEVFRWRWWILVGTAVGLLVGGVVLLFFGRPTRPRFTRHTMAVIRHPHFRPEASSVADRRQARLGIFGAVTTSMPRDQSMSAFQPSAGTMTGSNVSGVPAQSWDGMEMVQQLWGLLDGATPQERETAEQLVLFGSTGKLEDLRAVSRTDMAAFAQKLTEILPADEIAARLEELYGIPRAITSARGDIKQSLVDLYDTAVQTAKTDEEESPLTFTDQCDVEGKITGSTDVLPSGVKRVYAVFKNEGNLANQEYVLAIWSNLNDDSFMYSEAEPLLRDSLYNYVWLESNESWPAGTYQLKLCDPQYPAKVLARKQFTVR